MTVRWCKNNSEALTDRLLRPLHRNMLKSPSSLLHSGCSNSRLDEQRRQVGENTPISMFVYVFLELK